METMPDTPEAALLRLNPALAGVDWVPLAGGRTNRLWRVGGYTVKRFDLDAASPLFPNDPAAEARALGLFHPLGLAPRLCAAGRDWLIYEHVEGVAASAAPEAVARMLHRLHKAKPGTGFRAAPNGSAAVLADAMRIYALEGPPDDPGLPAVAAVPIHADVVAGNVLATERGVLLIDWQCPALGDPVEDICTYLSPAMTWLYTGQTMSAEKREAFLRAYPDPAVVARARAMQPLYDFRIRAHCAWKAARGYTDYAQAMQIGA